MLIKNRESNRVASERRCWSRRRNEMSFEPLRLRWLDAYLSTRSLQINFSRYCFLRETTHAMPSRTLIKAFFLHSHSLQPILHSEQCWLQWDSISERQSRRRSRWPYNHHRSRWKSILFQQFFKRMMLILKVYYNIGFLLTKISFTFYFFKQAILVSVTRLFLTN